jgi:hypothetical protein
MLHVKSAWQVNPVAQRFESGMPSVPMQDV